MPGGLTWQAAFSSLLVVGTAGEARALAHLLGQGLTLVQRNYRVARGPGARGGEIDLILRERDGTLVFVEVRVRRAMTHGGAAASVGAVKQRSLMLDVIALEGEHIEWLRAAFDAG